MSSDTFLSPEEVRSLTYRRTRPAQVRVLNALGIEHKVRPDGSIVVLRAHIDKVFDGNSATKKPQAAASPNWGAV